MLKVKTSTQVFSKNFQMSQLTVQRNQKICNLLNFEKKKKKKYTFIIMIPFCSMFALNVAPDL